MSINDSMKKDVFKGKSLFRKMIEDKRAMHAYIQAYGTLKGFNLKSAQFAKPL